MTQSFVFRSPEKASKLPLVFDSPHSGQGFPADFFTSVDSAQLQTGCDLFVDDLWAEVPSLGGYLLHGLYSRMYIDLNRAPDDIDPLLLDGPCDGIKPTAYSERGMGLIRRLALPNVPIYKDKLSLKQIQSRIQHYHKPYHEQLRLTLDALHQEFAGVWHIDCHSMKSRGNGMNIDNGVMRPDVVLGDNDGQSAGADFVDVIEKGFRQLGYAVARNVPYKGGYLVRHYGDLKSNRHSMQIEINRALYMNEQTFQPNANYASLKQDLSFLARQIADYVSESVGKQD